MAEGFSKVADNLLNERLERDAAVRQAAFDRKTAFEQATLEFTNAVESARAKTAVSGLRAQEGIDRARFDAEKRDFQRKQLEAKRSETETPAPAQITQQGDPMRTLTSGAGIGGGASSGIDIASMIQEAVAGGSAVQGQVHTDPGTGRVFESGQAPTTPFAQVNLGLEGLQQASKGIGRLLGFEEYQGIGPGMTRTVLQERPDIQMQQERLGLEREQVDREQSRLDLEQKGQERLRTQQAFENVQQLNRDYPSMPGEIVGKIENARQNGDFATMNTLLSGYESNTEKLAKAQIAAEWNLAAKYRGELEKTNLELGQAKEYAQSMKIYDYAGIGENPTTGRMSDQELAAEWRQLTSGTDNITDPAAIGSLHMLQRQTLRRTGTLTFFAPGEEQSFTNWVGEETKVSQLPVSMMFQLMDLAGSDSPRAEEARKAIELATGARWKQYKETKAWDLELDDEEALSNPNLSFWVDMRNLYVTRQVLQGKSPDAPLPETPSQPEAAVALTGASETPQGPRSVREAGENLGRNIRRAVDPTERMQRFNRDTKAAQERARAEERRRVEQWMAVGRGTKAAAKGTGEFIGGIGSGLAGE